MEGIRCFIDSNGFVSSIDEYGRSAYPAELEVVGDTVRVLGAKDDLGPGRLVEDEYQLWPSLTALAAALEC